MSYTPIVLFTYNRLRHLEKTVEALQKNTLAQESELFIFSDGARSSQDADAVANVRTYIKTISGFKNIKIHEAKENKGLARSIEDGVTEIVNRYSQIIVLEDDIVTSPYFLTYMNNALNMYKDEPRVMHINGYCPPINMEKIETDSFFYRLTMSWGWATWQDRWKKYNNNATELLTELKKHNQLKYFDIDDSFRFSSTLRANIRGNIKTWAIKWYASVVLNNGLSLYPYKSLVKNIGHDGSGTNALKSNSFSTKASLEHIKLKKLLISENVYISQKISEYFKDLKPTLLHKIAFKLKLLQRKK